MMAEVKQTNNKRDATALTGGAALNGVGEEIPLFGAQRRLTIVPFFIE
jgi:hypothetical protein